MASIPACHAGDRGSIPRDGVSIFIHCLILFYLIAFPFQSARATPMLLLFVQYNILIFLGLGTNKSSLNTAQHP